MEPSSNPPSESTFRGLVSASALGVVAAGLAVASLALLLLGHASLRDFDPTTVVLPFTFAAVGVVIVARVPRNPLGWLFVSAACLVGIEALGGAFAFRALVLHRSPHQVGVWAEWVINCLGGILFPAGLAAVMMLLLPNGHLPSPRWRPVVVAGPVITAVLVFGLMVDPARMKNATGVPAIPNPLGVRSLSFLSNSTFGAVVWSIGLVYAVVAASAPLARIRRASTEERQQLKWIGSPLAVTTVVYAAVAIGPGGVGTSGDGLVGWSVIILGYGIALPVAIGIAIVKFRLYSIDVAINRTVVYSILAAFVTAVYVAVATGIGSLIGSESNLGLSLVATAIVAAGFQPVRARAQRLANHIVYGARATPYEALAQFTDQAAGAYPMDEALTRMARVVAEGTRAIDACVWLRDNETLNPVAIWPADAERPAPLSVHELDVEQSGRNVRIVPVRRGDELLGALSARLRPTESFEPIETRLLAHLAGQAGLFLQNAGLTAELQRSIEEIEASRRRILRAEGEARRRIERDLHDGAQQHIVALTFKLGQIEHDLAAIPGGPAASVADLRAQAEQALDALRELAHGVYPPLLADRGLGDALRAHVRRVRLDVTVEAKGLPRYSREVEAAVYFCTLEALQNAQKHAHAQRAEIRLADTDDHLAFSITDDGDGFDVAAASHGGVGLASMTDRISTEGGTLTINSQAGRGTVIRGTIPLATTPTTLGINSRTQLASASADPDSHRGRQHPGTRGRPRPSLRR